MRTIHVVHAADLHLGAKLPGLGRFGRERAAEVIQNFISWIRRWGNNGVDLVLLAGDLFEGSEITSQSLEAIRQAMSENESVDFFIAPGNHDYYAPGSLYDQVWPVNVHIFRGDLTRVILPQKEAAVYGGGFTGTVRETSMWETMDWERERMQTEGMSRFLVVHGDVNAQDTPYHPIRLDTLPDHFFSYIALGHIHHRSPIQQSGGTPWAYSGNFDGSGFDETGLKGFYEGRVYGETCELHFVPASSRLFHRLSVDLSAIQNQTEALERIHEAIQKDTRVFLDEGAQTDVRSSDGDEDGDEGDQHRSSRIDPQRWPVEKDLIRLRLAGQVDEQDVLDLNLLRQTLSERYAYIEVIDERTAHVNWPALAEEETLRGYFASNLYERWQNAEKNEKHMLERALRLGLDAIDGKELRLEDSDA